MSNEPIDYFDTEAAGDDYPLVLREHEYGTPTKVERSLEVYADPDSRPLTIDDAAAAIAGVIHLWRKPDEDLHGYTQYLDDARALLHVVSGFPTQDELDRVLATAIADSSAEALGHSVVEEAPRPRSLEEILGQ